MFQAVLIANRGEIAVRVIRTLRAMGIRSVAVYSDADVDARHVRDADVAVRIGPAAARRELPVHRARSSRQPCPPAPRPCTPVTASWPRTPASSAACADAGLVFVGPPASAIEAMGDKIRAKQTVEAAGVPVVPGRHTPGLTDEDLAAAADGDRLPGAAQALGRRRRQGHATR
ncbi:MAG: biotin carboxylase N-terminal domain-containing protein [Hymenobacter sp.]